MVRLDEVCFAPVFRFARRAMRQFAEARGAIVLIAESDAGMVGFLIAHLEGMRRVPGDPFGYLVTIDVDPAARRLGVGKLMLREAEEQVRAVGLRRVDLHVARDNAAAIRFYEREGYGCIGMVEEFYPNGLDALVYRKGL